MEVSVVGGFVTDSNIVDGNGAENIMSTRRSGAVENCEKWKHRHAAWLASCARLMKSHIKKKRKN